MIDEKKLVKIRYNKVQRFLEAVMPSGEIIPCVTDIKINSIPGDVVTATLEIIIDTSEFKEVVE